MVNVKFIKLSIKDNVVTLLEDAEVGQLLEIGHQSIKIKEKVKFGHKIAIKNISPGENIMKYGEVIGAATYKIEEGHHAHVHNIESLRVRHDLKGSEV